MRRLLVALCLLGLSLPSWVDAACTGSSPTWNATADESSIGTCITNAVSGDTVNIAAGTATINTTIYGITGKRLTIVGAGIGNTIIRNQASGGTPAFYIVASATNFVDISGISFVEVTAAVNGIVRILGTSFEVAYRFHHNAVTNSITGGRGFTAWNVYGLTDHVDFIVVGNGSPQQWSIFGHETDGGYSAWAQPLGFGTANANFIENSTFTRSNILGEDAIDMSSGARAVIRYNTFTNAHAGFHGTDSGQRLAPVSVEVYNNTYTNTTTSNFEAGRMRGGTGVWYSNTWATTSSGTWGNINLLVYRAGDGDTTQSWGQCNGTQYVVGSSLTTATASRYTCDSTTSPTAGLGGCAKWPSITWVNSYGFDATNPNALPLGVHGTGNNTAFFDGAGTGGYPCRGQVGRAPGQVLAPVYAWSNTGGQVLSALDAWSNNYGGFGIDNYLLSGRDFINNGSTPKPGYTAYAYPHPLIPASTPPAPDAIAAGAHMAAFSGNTFAVFIWPRSTDSNHKAYKVYRCTTSDPCANLVATITPASAAASHSPETQFYDTLLYMANTYYYSVADQNTSDYIGPTGTPVSITVTGKQ